MKAASVCTNQQWSQPCSCLTHKEDRQTMNWLEFGTGSPSCLPKSLALPLLWHSPVIPYSNRTTQQLMSQPLARQHPNLNTCLASVPAAKWSLRSMALIWRFSLNDKNKQEPPWHKFGSNEGCDFWRPCIIFLIYCFNNLLAVQPIDIYLTYLLLWLFHNLFWLFDCACLSLFFHHMYDAWWLMWHPTAEVWLEQKSK